MMNPTKIKIRKNGDQARVLVLVRHPMETGRRKDESTRQRIPAHYIETMTFELNGKVVAEASLGPGVAANPMTVIAIDHAEAGDQVDVRWKDNKGQRGGARATI